MRRGNRLNGGAACGVGRPGQGAAEGCRGLCAGGCLREGLVAGGVGASLLRGVGEGAPWGVSVGSTM